MSIPNKRSGVAATSVVLLCSALLWRQRRPLGRRARRSSGVHCASALAPPSKRGGVFPPRFRSAWSERQHRRAVCAWLLGTAHRAVPKEDTHKQTTPCCIYRSKKHNAQGRPKAVLYTLGRCVFLLL